MKIQSSIFVVILIGLIALVGYGVMHLLIYTLPMAKDSTWIYLFYTIVVIVLGMAVPYGMLKLGFHHAHQKNSKEVELELKDLPKDKKDLAKTHR